MTFLAPVRASINPRVALRQTYTAIFAFHTSSARPGMKESNHGRDDLANVHEGEKSNQLKNHKDGKVKWSEDLASSSEASIKADRGEVEDFKDLRDRPNKAPNQ